jgi:hypothetical protein
MNLARLAIAGPSNEIPAMGLSADATACQIPLVVHRSFNFRLGNPYNLLASTVYPDLLQAQAVQQSPIFQGEPILSQYILPLTEIGLQSG